MATNSFKSIHQHHHTLRRRHSIDCPFSSSSSSSSSSLFFLKPITKNPSSSTSFSNHNLITFSVSSTTPTTAPSTTPTPSSTPFDVLEQHLSAQNFREADEETRRMLIVLAGEAAVKRGYVFFSEVQFIPESDLKEIDSLWRKYSDNKFGYSVQKQIWNKANRDFTNFFIKVGWMKKLEIAEVDQYNYRSFPTEFIWELNDETPEGHLPLTNALRGTQLLNSIFTHPAFVEEGEEEEEEKEESSTNSGEDKGSVKKGGLFGGLRSKLFSKPDYSF